nr:MAG TPA: hypothetical protein [Caudoviricetes sp.]
MKNITRTIRVLTVEFPVKSGNGFLARTENVIDTGAAAIRAELKKRCSAADVKFLGEYEVVSVEERTFSMPIDMFVEYANVVD